MYIRASDIEYMGGKEVSKKLESKETPSDCMGFRCF